MSGKGPSIRKPDIDPKWLHGARQVTPSARVAVHLGRPQQPLSVWKIEFLDSFIPAATVLKLNIQVFGVESKHRYRGQKFPRQARFILPLDGPHRFCPSLTDAMAKA